MLHLWSFTCMQTSVQTFHIIHLLYCLYRHWRNILYMRQGFLHNYAGVLSLMLKGSKRLLRDWSRRCSLIRHSPSKCFQVTFGLNPPVFDAVRMPRETAARALLTAMQEARHRRPEGSVEPLLGTSWHTTWAEPPLLKIDWSWMILRTIMMISNNRQQK